MPGDEPESTRPRIERIAGQSRDKDISRPRGSRIESVEVDDDEKEEEAKVENGEEEDEDDESVGDAEKDRTDEEDDESEEETSGEKNEKKGPKLKELDNDDDDKESEDDDDEEDDERIFKKDSKRQMKEIKTKTKTPKIVKSVKYSKSKTVDVDEDDDDEDKDDDDDDDDEDKDESEAQEEEQVAGKTDKRKVIGPVRKQVSPLHKKQDQTKIQVSQSDDGKDDEVGEKDKEADTGEVTPVPRKLEKVRLADKDKVKAAKILPSKLALEKPKQEERKSTDVVKSNVETAKKTGEGTKKSESIEGTKKLVEVTQRPAERAKKLLEDVKQVESVKTAVPKPKTEASVTSAKIDEKSKARAKPETSTPAPKIKEQAKQPQKADVKKAAVKPTLQPLKEVSRAESEYYMKMF